MYTKSPCNWVGNKYKHLDKINEIVDGRDYRYVIEPFMGSGNILLNINTPATKYIGGDNIPLVPKLYSYMQENRHEYTQKEFEDILKAWHYFSDKEDYYVFRNYWNAKYTNNVYDKNFVYETVALLKMCSNSMVRFNRKGEFNQGFRGLAKGKSAFFSERMKYIIIKQLNLLSIALNQRNYIFKTRDFKDTLKLASPKDLLILDPPYIMRTDMYDTNFTEEDDESLLYFLSNTKSNFIYFNYVESDKILNEKIDFLIIHSNAYKITEINNKTKAGQGRKGTKEVKEVIITNI